MSIFSEKRRFFKQRKFKQIAVLAVCLSVFLGIVIVPVERTHPEGSIKNLSDGLWWAFQTLTTVGYGDTTPVTPVGRLMASVLILTGAVMYGVLIAIISSSMSRTQEEFYWIRLFERMDRMEQDLAELRKQNSYLLKAQTDPAPTQARPSLRHKVRLMLLSLKS